MKIELEVPNITTAATAMNNATIAYGKIIRSAMLGCEVPSEFGSFQKLDNEILIERYNCLKDLYEQIEAIENKIIKGM